MGCMQFLREKSIERASDLRLSQQASYMQGESVRDMRHFFEFVAFRVDILIAQITNNLG